MNWIARANDFKQNPINGTAEVCSKKTLLVQAVKKVGLFLGLAMVSLFIPLLHFILVPAFLLLGALASGNVGQGAHHAQRSAFFGKLHDLATRAHPQPVPIGMAHAVLGFKSWCAAAQVCR